MDLFGVADPQPFDSDPFFFRFHFTLLKLDKLVYQHGSTFVSKREDSWQLRRYPDHGLELERPLPVSSQSQKSSAADCICIQLFTSMRIRIQGA
jgi:hypothetical protein